MKPMEVWKTFSSRPHPCPVCSTDSLQARGLDRPTYNAGPVTYAARYPRVIRKVESEEGSLQGSYRSRSPFWTWPLRPHLEERMEMPESKPLLTALTSPPDVLTAEPDYPSRRRSYPG